MYSLWTEVVGLAPSSGLGLLLSKNKPEDADLSDATPTLLAFLSLALPGLEIDRSLAVHGFFLESTAGTMDEVEVP